MTALHHEVSGLQDAPVLVLAGSLGSTLATWDPQVEALSDRFRVVRTGAAVRVGPVLHDRPFPRCDALA